MDTFEPNVLRYPTETPSPNPGRFARFDRAAELVAESPGTWFRIAQHQPNPNLARNIRSGRIKGFRKVAEEAGGRFETQGLREVWGTYSIAVRFIRG